jgi:hypothetical protein
MRKWVRTAGVELVDSSRHILQLIMPPPKQDSGPADLESSRRLDGVALLRAASLSLLRYTALEESASTAHRPVIGSIRHGVHRRFADPTLREIEGPSLRNVQLNG